MNVPTRVSGPARVGNVALALALTIGGVARGQGIALIDVTPALRPGPYRSLAVAGDRFAVGTADGWVLASDDGGATVDEEQVTTPRSYMSAPLRSLPPPFSLLTEATGGRTALSGLVGEPPGTRYFLFQLAHGRPVGKWQYWMAVDDPRTEVLGLTAPGARHPLAATAAGLFRAGAHGAGYVRVAGVPHPRGEALAALAVTIDPEDARHVLAGTSDGLLVSHDGGATFAPHPDRELGDAEVRLFYWDPAAPQHLLAATARTIYQSRDGGATFRATFSSRDGIRAVALAAEGAYVATGSGLIVPGGDGGVTRRLAGEAVVGVVPLGDGWFVTATEEALLLSDGKGETRTLMRAAGDDVILRLEGNADGAWVLSRYGLRQLATRALPRAPRLAQPPRLLLGPESLERAVVAHTGMGGPTRTRLGKTWVASLLPTLTIYVQSAVSHQFVSTTDALLPFPVRLRESSGASFCCGALPTEGPANFVALLTWNLAQLFVAWKQPTYPYGIIEMNLRAMREQILPEVRWRYRDAAQLAARLAQPPRDEATRFLWQTRLAEQAAYLEAMSGRPVVDFGSLEEFP
jgi:photosystem II stability/assembly factor-like uncharacterized protein